MMRTPAACLVALALATCAGTAWADDDPWIARDKALHFDVSAGIAAAAYGTSAGLGAGARWKSLAWGGGIAFGAGAAKELLDLAGLGDPSWKDLSWDAIGTLAGLVLAWGVDLLVGGVGRDPPAFGAGYGR